MISLYRYSTRSSVDRLNNSSRVDGSFGVRLNVPGLHRVGVHMDSLESAAQIAKKLPDEALTRVTDTVCITFEQVLAPATALGGGIGRLIEETFDDLSKLRKMYASHVLRLTKEKLRGKAIKPLESPATAIEVIAAVGTATDPSLQDLWANLLANELVSGGIHPEIPRAMARLTSADAQLLTRIKRPGPRLTITSSLGTPSALASKLVPKQIYFPTAKPDTPSHWILASCGLVRQAPDGRFYLTTLGQSFLAAVADPDAQKTSPESPGKAAGEPTLESAAVATR